MVAGAVMAAAAPPRVMVNVCPFTEVDSVPFMSPGLNALPEVTLDKLNPLPGVDGKMITILPLAGRSLAMVKETVTLPPCAPATREAGWTLVAVKAPAVILSAATAALVSMSASPPDLVVIA